MKLETHVCIPFRNVDLNYNMNVYFICVFWVCFCIKFCGYSFVVFVYVVPTYMGVIYVARGISSYIPRDDIRLNWRLNRCDLHIKHIELKYYLYSKIVQVILFELNIRMVLPNEPNLSQ